MILSFHHVAPDGAIALAAANVPYTNLQWNRSYSAPGTFTAQLACALPVEWPGRYLVTLDGCDETGIVEKVEVSEEGAGGTSPVVSGRFAESLMSRYRLGRAGGAVCGADWRQAATAAMLEWVMGDAPALKAGQGCEEPTGSSYAIAGEAGDDAVTLLYAALNAHGAYPLLTYDRDADDQAIEVRIVEGLDRTRGQSERPFALFSLGMGTASSLAYSGDWSCACSVVEAFAKPSAEGAGVIGAEVAVEGFDAETQWEQRAVEDVGSLIDAENEAPSAGEVAEAGRVRSYDHMPALAVDCATVPEGYRTRWDLGDMVEAELSGAGIVARARVEAVRETYKDGGVAVEATVGAKSISRARRALMGRR